MLITNDIKQFNQELEEFNTNNIFTITVYDNKIYMKIFKYINKTNFKKLRSKSIDYRQETFTFEVKNKLNVEWIKNDNGYITIRSEREKFDIKKEVFDNAKYFVFINEDIKEIIRKCNK